MDSAIESDVQSIEYSELVELRSKYVTFSNTSTTEQVDDVACTLNAKLLQYKRLETRRDQIVEELDKTIKELEAEQAVYYKAVVDSGKFFPIELLEPLLNSDDCYVASAILVYKEPDDTLSYFIYTDEYYDLICTPDHKYRVLHQDSFTPLIDDNLVGFFNLDLMLLR